jgi:hypothetical protein
MAMAEQGGPKKDVEYKRTGREEGNGKASNIALTLTTIAVCACLALASGRW